MNGNLMKNSRKTEMRAPEPFLQILQCPDCGQRLQVDPAREETTCGGCLATFFTTEGVPILLSTTNELFSADACRSEQIKLGAAGKSFLNRLLDLLPKTTLQLNVKEKLAMFFSKVQESQPHPKVLVIGGGMFGTGMASHIDTGNHCICETDVYLGPRVDLVCDAHQLPFQDNSVDGIIAQAVLEHVLDPPRCVAEMWRVLKPGGHIFVDIPFMQQVHAGAFDFTRYTHIGQRRLFRQFDEIASGISSGPGSAFAWAYEYLLLSLVRGRTARGIMRAIARITGSWVKYLDLLSKNNPAALDAACGIYFVGRKTQSKISDSEILRCYHGGMTAGNR